MKNFLYLLGGTVLAQLCVIAVSPILSRIYTPEDFGDFSLLVTIGYLVTAVICLRLDFAILSISDINEKILIKRKAIELLIINTIIVLIFGFGLSFLGFITWDKVILFAALTIISGAYNIYYNLALSLKNQKINFWGKFIQGGGGAASQLILGVFTKSYVGLLVGQILGLLYSFLYLKRNVNLIKKIDLKINLKKYKNFIYADTVNSFFTVLSNHSSLLAIIFFYGAGFAGAFYMASRVLMLPISIVSVSISQYLTSRFSNWNEKGLLNSNLNIVFQFLILIAFLPGALFSFIVQELFLFVLGAQWIESSVIVWFCMLWIVPKFVFDSFAPLFSLRNYQKQSAAFQISMNLLRVTTILVCFYLGYTGIEMIKIFSWFVAIFYLYGLILFIRVFRLKSYFLVLNALICVFIIYLLNVYNFWELWALVVFIIMPIWLFMIVQNCRKLMQVFNEN